MSEIEKIKFKSNVGAKDFVVEGDGTTDLLEVNLGDGGAVGGYNNGDKIEAGTSIMDILKKLLQKSTGVTYSEPVLSLSHTPRYSNSLEYGTVIDTEFTAEFDEKDAGAWTSFGIFKNDTLVASAGTNSNTVSYSVNDRLTDTLTIKAVVEYSETPESKHQTDNLGNTIIENIIKADNMDKTFTYTPYVNGYYYGVLDKDTAITGDVIRNTTYSKPAGKDYSSGSFDFYIEDFTSTNNPNKSRIFIACISDKTGVSKVIETSAMTGEVTFTKLEDTVSVKNLNATDDSDAREYTVWILDSKSTAFADGNKYTVTLG